MTENGITDAEAAAKAAEAAEPTSFVNEDGTLKDGWKEGYLEEDIRGEKVFDRVKTIQGAFKSLASAEKMVGRNKVAIPTEASSDVEWDAYYAAGGRPETAGDYNLTRPEELAEEFYSQELATAAQDLFHKIGLSKKQADALFAFNNGNVIAQLTKSAQDKEFAAKTLKDGLYTEWGDAFEQKKHLGNMAVEQGTGGDEEFKVRLTQKYGNDPDFIKFAANVGGKFIEHGAVDTSKLIPTPGDIQAQIDEEIAKPVYSGDYAKHGFTKAQHKLAVEKVSRLFQEKTKHTKTG